ncbi:unnamed protein product, partial [Oikopleura dioica]
KNGRFCEINEDDFDFEKGVALAFDNETVQHVIVKALFPRKPVELEYARREARTLAQLDHQNVVKFVDFLEDEKPEWVFARVIFLVAENCSGGSLVEWIQKMKEAGRRSKLDEGRIIAAQLVSALSFCHDQKPAVVHQDIKPANIFVMDDFITIKLGDFGSAATIKSVSNMEQYGAPEMFNSDDVKKSAQLDVWGFALVLQEVLTLEHAFGRVQGRPALFTEIQVNIQRHENPQSTRTSLKNTEFSEFEALLEKCTSADRSRRPKNAIELRNEALLAVFRYRLENGERPCEIVSPPFEDEKDAQIRIQKEELAKKDRKIAELEIRLNAAENSRNEIEENREIIEKLNEKNTKLEKEKEKLKKELAKMRPSFAKIESELNEARNLIQQLTTEHESEREQWTNEMRKNERKAKAPELKLKNENEKIKNDELEKLRKELGEIGGSGHFWGNDKEICRGGVRDSMGEEELKKVIGLLAAGEKKINLKFWLCDNWEVAEAGWTIKFKSAWTANGGDDQYFYLWISNKEGGAKFKATVQQIDSDTGEEANRRELQSEKDGTRQLIKYEEDDDAGYFVRFNITIL